MRTTRYDSYLFYGALLLLPLLPACELIPGLLSDPAPVGATAALSVSIDSAEGQIDGRTLSVGQLEAQGFQQHGGVELSVRVGPDTTLQLSTPEVFGGSDNPYGEPGSRHGEHCPEDGEFDDGGLHDAGPAGGISAGPAPFILVCSPTGCREPAEFELRSVEGADGRHMVFEGQWDGGDRAAIELHYRREL